MNNQAKNDEFEEEKIPSNDQLKVNKHHYFKNYEIFNVVMDKVFNSTNLLSFSHNIVSKIHTSILILVMIYKKISILIKFIVKSRESLKFRYIKTSESFTIAFV